MTRRSVSREGLAEQGLAKQGLAKQRLAKSWMKVGINMLPFFVDADGNATIDRVVDHLEHAAEVAGIDHVGFGPDFIKDWVDEVHPTRERYAPFGGVDMKEGIPGLAGTRDLPNLTERMVDRGWQEADVRKALGENWLRVLRAL